MYACAHTHVHTRHLTPMPVKKREMEREREREREREGGERGGEEEKDEGCVEDERTEVTHIDEYTPACLMKKTICIPGTCIYV